MTSLTPREQILGWGAILFGLLTIVSGGSVLLGPEGLRSAAGDVVLPVLWFNALSGAVYAIVGIGILTRRPWSRPLARLLAATIGAMLILLVVLIATGTPWEPRTLVAMAFRFGVWVAIAVAAPDNRTPRADTPAD